MCTTRGAALNKERQTQVTFIGGNRFRKTCGQYFFIGIVEEVYKNSATTNIQYYYNTCIYVNNNSFIYF